MATWDVWHDKLDQGVSGVDFGRMAFENNENVIAFFNERYPTGHIEDFSDEIHVYVSLEDFMNDEEPIAGATYEG
jgi:hypothetical protein